jgi:hypothetical protein
MACTRFTPNQVLYDTYERAVEAPGTPSHLGAAMPPLLSASQAANARHHDKTPQKMAGGTEMYLRLMIEAANCTMHRAHPHAPIELGAFLAKSPRHQSRYAEKNK